MYTIIHSDNYYELKKYVDEKVLLQMDSNRHICYSFSDGYLISFRYYNIRKLIKDEDSVFVYLQNDNIIFICNNDDICETIKTINKDDTTLQQLLGFFSALTSSDIFELERFEDKITYIEDHLLTQKKSDANDLKKIMSFRNKLLKVKRYYEELAMIIDEICENKNNILEEKLKEHFHILGHRVDKLLDYTMHLREYITQVREAYQAQIDIEQNNIMRIFTVMTTIFFPLTLIAGWYGMNFNMPEYGWKFGYLFVISLSVFISFIGFIIFKRKKWF